MTQPAAAASSLLPDGAIPRIMVIEDEPLIAMGLKMVLENMGCEVPITVDNAADAVAHAQSQPFDLILADVRLKGAEDGISAIERILMDRKVRVLFVTGNASEVANRGMGHIDVLSKPFMPAALERSVRAILSRR
ncbi:MAG TPA: response regulator [Candidatus Omnitrophota bacterium]|nr:response regulator [Candidatus Omnitrophota bacterium]